MKLSENQQEGEESEHCELRRLLAAPLTMSIAQVKEGIGLIEKAAGEATSFWEKKKMQSQLRWVS